MEQSRYPTGLALAEHIAGDLNAIFERGEMNSTIGQVVLIPLRSEVLLNSIHKVFSLVFLGCMHEQVDRYLPTSQSTFWKGRSTTNIIFAKCVLSTVVHNKVTGPHILGIDLSHVFATVDRHWLLHIVSEVINNIDVVSMVQVLFTQTTFQVHIKMSKHQHFRPTLALHKEIASGPFFSIATTRQLHVTRMFCATTGCCF